MQFRNADVLYEHGSSPRFGEFAEPSAGEGQIVVKVAAAALHHLDLHKAPPPSNGAPPLPSMIGTDGVWGPWDATNSVVPIAKPPSASPVSGPASDLPL